MGKGVIFELFPILAVSAVHCTLMFLFLMQSTASLLWKLIIGVAGKE